MRTIAFRSRVSAVLHGLLTAVLDTAFVAICATMLWWNGRATVMDPPLSALSVILIAGAALVGLRRALSLRRRRGAADPGAMVAERVSIPVQLGILAAVGVIWKVTGDYPLGWGFCFASVATMVGNSLHLLVDVTTRTETRDSRQSNLHWRRFASIESLHILAALLGIVGMIVAAPIHLWRAEILNGAVLLVAAAVLIGTAFGVLIQWIVTRIRADASA